MFLHLLFLLASSDPSTFDRFERRYNDKSHCDTVGISNQGAIKIELADYEDGYLRGCQNLVSVELANDLTEIKKYSFYGSSLKTINWGSAQITTIGEGAFAFCEELTTITLPATVAQIDEGAFFFSHITDPGFGSCNGLTTIGKSAYEGSLVKGTISFANKPATLNINDRAFHSTKITGISGLPENAVIGNYAFANCSTLSTIASPLNVGSIGDYAFDNCRALTGQLQITTTNVGDFAFYNTGDGLIITGILQKTVSNTPLAIEIGAYAFAGKQISCGLSYPNSAGTANIGEFAFYKCRFTSAQPFEINIQYSSGNKQIGNYAFANTTYQSTCSLTLHYTTVGKHAFEFTSGPGALELKTAIDRSFTINEYSFYYSHVSTTANGPLYLKSVNKKSFAHCSNLRGLLNITNLGLISPYAFANCTNLAGPLEIDGASIGESAFEFCNLANGLKYIDGYVEGDTHPKLTIGYRAFYASGLSKELVLHSFITSIGEYAFARCEGLINSPITIYAQDIDQYAFAECKTLNGQILIYSNNIYFHAFDKTTIGTLIIDTKYDHDSTDTPPASYHVHNQAFYGITFTGQVLIRDHVVIDDFAFIYSTFGTHLIIDADSIGKYAFTFCDSSNNCNVSIGETSIDQHAFEYFGRQRTAITLEFHAKTETRGPKTIGLAAFNTTGFSNHLVIPRYYTGVGREAFANCQRIKSASINFGQTLLSGTSSSPNIGYSSFEGSGLTELSITSNGLPVSIDDRAFYGLGINHIMIMPLTLTSVGSSAFQDCKSLRGVVFDHNSVGLTYIGISAFSGCNALSGEVYIPKSVETIDESAFENCTQLSRLVLILEGSLSYIKDRAFMNCRSLDGSLDFPYVLEEIGDHAFYNCVKLGEHISLKTEQQLITDLECTIGDHAFEGCSALKTFDLVPTRDNIDNYYQKLISIGDYAFYNSGISGYLYLPSSLQTIGDCAFQGTAISGKLDFNQGITSIGNSAFQSCRSIEGLTFVPGSRSDELTIGDRAFYQTSIKGAVIFPNYVSLIGESAFESLTQLVSVIFMDGTTDPIIRLSIQNSAFKSTGLTGVLTLPSRLRTYYSTYPYRYGAGIRSFADCRNIKEVIISGGQFDAYVFENCVSITRLFLLGGRTGAYDFKGCTGNITVYFFGSATVGDFTFADHLEGPLYIDISGEFDDEHEHNFVLSSSDYVNFGERCFYNSSLNGSLDFSDHVYSIDKEAFAECKNLLGNIYLCVRGIDDRAFANSDFNGSLIINFDDFDSNNYVVPSIYGENVFKGSTGLVNLSLIGDSGTKTTISNYAFSGMSFPYGVLEIDQDVTEIGKYAFQGCGFYKVDCRNSYRTTSSTFTVAEGAFANCDKINITIDFTYCSTLLSNVPIRLFYRCSNLPEVIFPTPLPSSPKNYKVDREAFYGCSSFYIHPDFFLDVTRIERNAFSGCSSLRGPLYIADTLNHIDEYAFSDCTGLSDRMTIHVNPSAHKYIGPSAFSGCSGFKKSKLYIIIDSNEEEKYTYADNVEGAFRPYYKYNYFLTIGNEAFEDTKFKDVYYNGRFQPECDYDIGFSHTKGIHTSSNYVNKSFCGYPLHSSKLSGGAIAGITIAVIVVVAAIILLLLFFICRAKKNKDHSEDEVEMNADP